MNRGINISNETTRKGVCKTLINTIQLETTTGLEVIINALIDKGYDVEKKYIPVTQHDAHVEIKVYGFWN